MCIITAKLGFTFRMLLDLHISEFHTATVLLYFQNIKK